MNIGEAVEALHEGKRVRRPLWAQGLFMKISNGRVFEHREYGQGPIVLSIAEFDSCDVLAEDWEVAP